MRIGIDGRNLALREGTGVASYARTVWSSVERLGHAPVLVADRPLGAPAAPPDRRVDRLFRLARAQARQRGLTLADDGAALTAPDLFRTAHVRSGTGPVGRTTRLRAHDPPDLMHWTTPLPLVMQGVPNLVTVHDLIPIETPELSGIDPRRLAALLRRLAGVVDRFVTVSEHGRAALIRELGLAEGRVVSLGQAVDLPPALVEAARVVEPVCAAGGFVCLGRLERRKNVRGLLAAYAASGTTRPLVWIGPRGDDDDGAGLGPVAQPLGAGSVRHVPYAPRAAVVRALLEARALLFVSLAEGFGLPAAEALTLGTPVLASRGGALDEVTRGAAIAVDPRDIAAIAAAIVRLDRDDALCAGLRRAGLARAPAFALDAHAERLGALYRDILSGAGRGRGVGSGGALSGAGPIG